jgi:Tol biopolymer transport system component
VFGAAAVVERLKTEGTLMRQFDFSPTPSPTRFQHGIGRRPATNGRAPSRLPEAFVAALWACLFGVGSVARAAPPARPLREVVVSYADESGKLQLYRVNEDGSGRRRITDGTRDCSMPAWSPDGKKLVYVRQGGGGNELWLSSPDGEDPRMLVGSGMNLVPSWLPDSRHIVWMTLTPEDESFGAGLLRVVWMVSRLGKKPAEIGRLRIMDTETGQSRPLFREAEQPKVSNLMPAVSPDGTKVAFVSNRGGRFRIWSSNLDGSAAEPVSPLSAEADERLRLPIEQKVPSWSPDGRWLAHWEGVEMDHMSPFTGKSDPQRDALIEGTWNVWIVGRDGKGKRMAGHGDDPNWSPDGFLTRSFPDKSKGGAKVMVQTEDGWRELPIVPPKTLRYGRFTWRP